jgi:16S rRNA processing protein RimM
VAPTSGFAGRFDPGTLPIGLVGKPHGTRGDITVRAFQHPSEALDLLSPPFEIVLDTPAMERRRLVATQVRRGPDKYLVSLDGVTHPDEAAALTGSTFRIERALLPPTAPGEIYAEDLLGCTVYDQDGLARGQGSGLMWNGAHFVLAVRDENGHESYVSVAPGQVLDLDIIGRRAVLEFLEEEVAGRPQGPEGQNST